MSVELEHLLETIEQEGVQKAEQHAAGIEKQARERAEQIVKQAEQRAAALKEQAEREAQLAEQRGRKALEQAARDTVLAVEKAVTALFQRLLARDVSAALDDETLRALVADVTRAYAAAEAGGAGARVTLSAEQAARLADRLVADLRDQVAGGVEIRPEGTVGAGFRLSISGSEVEHDFTAAAIAEALAALVRPELAKAIRNTD
jgi:V/A-type H+-transporting ATPase subunit E